MPDDILNGADTVIMLSAIARTRAYFESEYSFNVTEIESSVGDMATLTLLDKTAIIALGGKINLLVAFSFQKSLVDTMYAKMTESFDVAADEVEMYREATVGEVVNTILGHCTIDLQKLDNEGIPMTPPVIVDHVKSIQRMKNTTFLTQSLKTPQGQINISLIGSKDQFNTTR